MKKIFRYILLLIVAYLVVEIFVYFITKPYYRDMNNYQILVESPKIEITESQIATNKGYITGTVTNDTDEMIKDVLIVFDFYNEQGIQIGTKKEKIDVFNVTEKVKFDIKYEYRGVHEIKINAVSEVQ